MDERREGRGLKLAEMCGHPSWMTFSSSCTLSDVISVKIFGR